LRAELTFAPTVEEYGEGLREHASVLDEAIEAKLNSLAGKLLMDLQVNLSGEVLEQRTGKLIRSVEMQAAQWAGEVCGATVGIDEGQPAWIYGLVHNIGGLGYYDIFPVNAKALAFSASADSLAGSSPWGGMFSSGEDFDIVVKAVHHPPAKATHWFDNPVEALRATFVEEMKAVLDDVLGTGGEVAG
jgi:hypothetical protein